jgi:glycosyltransferase involved in cell wall biosynthesis
MKIALITPCYYPFVRGNSVTVRRIEKFLQANDCEVRVFSLDIVTAEDTLKDMKKFAPDIIHAFNGFVGGRIARLISKVLNIPYVITLTGTDVYEALHDGRKEETIAALYDAAALVAFHKSIKSRLLDYFPAFADKSCVIAQGVEIPGRDYFHHDDFHPVEGESVILLPAGLRPVKNVAFALPLLAKLHAEGMPLCFVLIGPVLHRGYAAEVLAEYEQYPFAHYFGEVGHNAIGWFYDQADIVLNTSSFEGGMANTVLEAMAMGDAVLASNIEGNRSVIKDGITGLLYQGEADFLEKTERLLLDAKLRARLGANGKRFVLNNFQPEKEAAAYISLYGKVLAGGGKAIKHKKTCLSLASLEAAEKGLKP